jgi:hypothetical protein
VAFSILVLDGRNHGASLVALEKKSSGVRPIAVGCTLRCLVAKTQNRVFMTENGRNCESRK